MRSCQGIGSRCNPRRSLFLGQNFGPVPLKFAAQLRAKLLQLSSDSRVPRVLCAVDSRRLQLPGGSAPCSRNSQWAPRLRSGPAPVWPETTNGLSGDATASPLLQRRRGSCGLCRLRRPAGGGGGGRYLGFRGGAAGSRRCKPAGHDWAVTRCGPRPWATAEARVALGVGGMARGSPSRVVAGPWQPKTRCETRLWAPTWAPGVTRQLGLQLLPGPRTKTETPTWATATGN